MIKTQIFTKTIVILGLFLMTSCTNDFEEINTNPNYPTTAEPSLLLPGIMREMVYNWGDQGWGEGFTVAQYGARLQFTSGDRYDWGPTGDPYNDAYGSLRDVENIIKDAKENADKKNYYGVALIIKSWIYSYLTDAYGDVPYLEATQGIITGNITPSFTPQQQIYEGILADLKMANELMIGENDITGDILYGGSILKWRKFANSLRLRLLMRISDVANAKAVAGMNEIISNATMYPIFESNLDGAYMQWNSDDPQPKYNTRSGSFDEVRLSTTLEARLKELNDTRLFVFAQNDNILKS